jgi:DNA repair protein RecO (recombination protein O)
LNDRVLLLRRVEHGDSDLIVTLLGRDTGKLAARARGARASKKRFGAALGWFVISDVELSRRPGRELYTLTRADVREAHLDLAADPIALSHASYTTELTRELTASEQPEPEIFALLVSSYRAIGAAPSRQLLRRFELRLLGLIGLAPSFDRCGACGSVDLDRGALLDPGGGGVLCSRCAAGVRAHGARPLAGETRHLLAAAAAPGELTDALSAVDPGVEPEVEIDAQRAMSALLSRHLSRPLRSLEFIAKMNASLR